MKNSIKWYASKTVWFSILFVVIGIANFFGFVDFQPSGDTLSLTAVIIGIIQFVLRYFTTKKLVA